MIRKGICTITGEEVELEVLQGSWVYDAGTWVCCCHGQYPAVVTQEPPPPNDMSESELIDWEIDQWYARMGY
jgi:hypothetical protein